MGLVKKTCKLIAVITVSAGTVGTIAFGTLLGLGANAKYEMNMKSMMPNIPHGPAIPGLGKAAPFIPGAGVTPPSISGIPSIPGGVTPPSISGIPSIPGIPNITPNSTIEMGIGSLNYGNMYVDGQKMSIPGDKGSYADAVKAAREYVNNPIPGSPAWILDMNKATVKAYDMMVSGAVLTSFSAAAIITSIPFFLLAKKKQD